MATNLLEWLISVSVITISLFGFSIFFAGFYHYWYVVPSVGSIIGAVFLHAALFWFQESVEE